MVDPLKVIYEGHNDPHQSDIYQPFGFGHYGPAKLGHYTIISQ